jgi:peroxiredoxin
MPGFGDRLGPQARWDLVNFLRALNGAEAARDMGPIVEPARPWLVAPDFTFGVGPMPQRTLRDYRGGRLVLLVLYSLPASRPRLERLAQQYELLVVLGTEVIAVPVDADPRAIRRIGAEPRILFPVVTEGAEAIVTAYGLFGSGAHAEFLIDRQGFIRARWIARGETRRDMNLLLAEIQQLNEERAPTAGADEHVH